MVSSQIWKGALIAGASLATIVLLMVPSVDGSDEYPTTTVDDQVYEIHRNSAWLVDLSSPATIVHVHDYIRYEGQTYPVTQIDLDPTLDTAAIRELYIPQTVSHISQLSLSYTISLESITVDYRNASYSSEDGILYNYDKTTLVKYPPIRDDDNITIRDSVDTLGYRSLAYSDNLKNIDLNNVTTIETGALWNCTGLTSIEISSKVKTIEGTPFTGCKSLEQFTVSPESQYFTSSNGILFSKDMTTLYKMPENNGVTAYTIPFSVITIHDGAFWLSGLRQVTIPEGVVTIGDSAFLFAPLSHVSIPSTVKTIGDTAFRHCELTWVELAGDGMTIGMEVFYGNDNLSMIGIIGTIESLDSKAFVIGPNAQQNITVYTNQYLDLSRYSDGNTTFTYCYLTDNPSEGPKDPVDEPVDIPIDDSPESPAPSEDIVVSGLSLNYDMILYCVFVVIVSINILAILQLRKDDR